MVGNSPACSCLANYIGRAPNCRPECTISAECPGNLACQNERCVDPCPGSCGANADCNVIKHRSVCSCRGGYTGDPFAGCIVIQSKKVVGVFRIMLFSGRFKFGLCGILSKCSSFCFVSLLLCISNIISSIFFIEYHFLEFSFTKLPTFDISHHPNCYPMFSKWNIWVTIINFS